MILNSTKYKNPQRTISGLLNAVSNADTIILCDTSLGAVAIELLEIPFDQWSTTYKVYIVDLSNNAGTNNITITAPIGFTINNQSSLVINTNGGYVTISVSSNTGYLGLSGSGSGNPISIANEGVQITPAVASMNFVGSLVNATAVGNATTITINPNFIVVNYTQLQTLISTNALIPAQQYLISNAQFINTVGKQEFVPIVIEAVSTNELQISGAGFFQNADYQGVGNYSGVPSYVANKGTWESGGIYVVGDVVIYNNLQYVNITGLNGGDPEVATTDWTFLPKATQSWINTSTRGYITEIDIIKYDSSTNKITYREDIRFNRIDNNLQFYSVFKEAFYVFQWGNNRVARNTVQNESYFDCINNARVLASASLTTIYGNSLLNFALLTLINNLGGAFDNNNILGASTIDIINSGSFGNNLLYFSTLDINNAGDLKRNTFFSSNIIISANDYQFINNEFNTNANFPITISNNTVLSNFQNNTFKNDISGTISNDLDFTNNSFDNVPIVNIQNQNIISKNVFVNCASFDIGNFATGTFQENISETSIIQITQNDGDILTNIISQYSNLDVVINTALIEGNVLNGKSAITISGTNTGTINYNQLLSSRITLATNNGSVNGNSLISGSQIQCTNVINGHIENNELSNSTILFDEQTNSIQHNILNNATISATKIESTIQFNNFSASTLSVANKISSGSDVKNNLWWDTTVSLFDLNYKLENTYCVKAQLIVPDLIQDIEGGIFQRNVGTIAYTLDLSSKTIYDSATKILTIPPAYGAFFGEYSLINLGVLNPIAFITGLNSQFATKFVAKTIGQSLDFQTLNGVAIAGITEIVSNQPAPASFVVTARVNGEDSIYIRPLGNLNGIEQYYKYQ
jgi:hypothetical protein